MNVFSRLHQVLFGAVVGSFLIGSAGWAAEPTAFELAKDGNRYLGEEAKDRVVEIRSDKSVASLTPNMWYVFYLDPAARGKLTEVKFAGGHKVDVKHHTGFMGISGKPRQLPPDKLKIDSDKALDVAANEPVLKNIKLTASQMLLKRYEDEPVWIITLWASKLSKPQEMVNIGEIFISAESGKVVLNKLKIKNVD